MLSAPQLDRTIIISCDSGRFIVAVQPSQPGDCEPESFDDHRKAFGFASGLRMTTRLKISDQSGVN